MFRGIKRHGVVQRCLKRTGKSNVRSLDDALDSLTGRETRRRRVFGEVPFGKSRVDIVVLVPGRTMIFVEFKTTKNERPPESAYARQVRASFGDFMRYVNSAPLKYRSNRTEGVAFYYLLTVEKYGDVASDETKILHDGLVIPSMRYERMLTELYNRYKTWVKKKIIEKSSGSTTHNKNKTNKTKKKRLAIKGKSVVR